VLGTPRPTRRRFLIGAASLCSSLALPQRVQARSSGPVLRTPVKRPPYLGSTFSPLQCYYLGLDYKAAFDAICRLGLDRIRLGAYWHEIEGQEHQYDFSTLDWLLERCHNHNIEVVLALGLKVPRYPEFHFPQWVRDRYDTGAGTTPIDQRSPALAARSATFLSRVVEHVRSAPALKYWQVENEPFTQLEITGGRWLSPAFVQTAVETVRGQARSDQKILLTGAIHLPDPHPHEDGTAFQTSLNLADAVGFNVYTKVPAGTVGSYLEPAPGFWQQLGLWQQQLVAQGREAWIAEAQAEPWEAGHLVAVDQPTYPSASPLQMQRLVGTLTDLGYETVLLWGCEYWFWHKTQGRQQWWWAAEQMARSPIG
jgi:Beta-galactosidase